MLEQERKYFENNLAKWLSEIKGMFVLIKDENLIGSFNTIEEALTEGARLFGMQPFLVRRIEERPDEIHIPALTLGILRADNTRSI